jgi:hypothetical protein
LKIPKVFINNNKKYYFVETCKNFVRYQTSHGICECFSFYDLGLIEEMAEPYKEQYRKGIMFFKNVI